MINPNGFEQFAPQSPLEVTGKPLTTTSRIVGVITLAVPMFLASVYLLFAIQFSLMMSSDDSKTVKNTPLAKKPRAIPR